VIQSAQIAPAAAADARTSGRVLNTNLLGSTAIAAALGVFTSVAAGAPTATPFLAVDINGYNAGGGQSVGPTAFAHQGFEAAEGLFLDPSIDWGNSGAAGLTRVFASSEGNITANMRGIAPNSFLGARNRGANTDGLGELTQDFAFAQRDPNVAFGQHSVRVSLSGLIPGQTYEVTAFARDHFNGGDESFQAWSDIGALGGLDGPGAWLNANVGAGATYQPAIGGVNNPIPTLSRSHVSGPASVDPYGYAATFLTVADAGGVAVFYGWADPDSFSGVQSASLLNGFQIGIAVPAPPAAVLIGLGMTGAVRRRHRAA